MSKKSNIKFIVKIAKYNISGMNFTTDYYIHKRYVDKYFRENCETKIRLVEVKTGLENRDYNDLVRIVFDKNNKNSKLSEYIEENYPEWLV